MLRTTMLVCQRGGSTGTAELAKILYKKKGPLHSASQTRPDAVATILHVPQSRLYEAVLRATKLHELDRDGLIRLLQKNRSFRRLDRSEVAIRAYRDAGRGLSPHHFSLMMAHANEAKQWIVALRYWQQASDEKKIRHITHAAYLQTLKVAGRWKDAMTHFNVMVEDKIPVDPFALHTIMNTMRLNAPWACGMQVFSHAVAAGTKPNALVFLLLLRCLSQSKHPHRWHYALSVLGGLRGSEHERNAGMFNAVMETLFSAGRWQQATQVYHSMQADTVAPSKETFRVLMGLRFWDAKHCVKSLGEAHRHGSPVTRDMYYRVFHALLSLGNGPKHVVALIESESSRAIADAGNPNYETLPLSTALLDCMLEHAVVPNLDLLRDSCHAMLNTVVPQATRGLCVLGQSTQRWISEGGRVAVVDHNALLNQRFESLRSHYDHALIPASCIRTLVRRTEGELAGSKEYASNQWLLARLRDELYGEKNTTTADGEQPLRKLRDWVHIMPVAHEFFARRHILPKVSKDGGVGGEELSLLRQSATDVVANLLLKGEAATSAPYGEHSLAIRGTENALTTSRPNRDVAKRIVPKEPEVAEPSFVEDPNWLTAAEKVIAVAVMLKTLNPDTDVHVVSRSRYLLEHVERWNAHSKTYHRHQPLLLTTVNMMSTDELMSKAPPQQIYSARAAQPAIEATSPVPDFQPILFS